MDKANNGGVGFGFELRRSIDVRKGRWSDMLDRGELMIVEKRRIGR